MSVFNIPTVRTAASPGAIAMGPAGGPGGGAGGGQQVVQQGVFVTPQTLTTFAGATLAVTMIWKAAGVVRPGLEAVAWVGLIASALVGIVLYLISESDPARGPVTSRDRMIGMFVALVNTLILYFAAVGASVVTE